MEKNVTAWPVHQTLRCLDQYLLDDVAVKNWKFQRSDFNLLIKASDLTCDANKIDTSTTKWCVITVRRSCCGAWFHGTQIATLSTIDVGKTWIAVKDLTGLRCFQILRFVWIFNVKRFRNSVAALDRLNMARCKFPSPERQRARRMRWHSPHRPVEKVEPRQSLENL